jgi:hypothetical protein
MAPNKIIRITMFKIASAEDQDAALAAYKTLTSDNKKVAATAISHLAL